VSLLSLERAGEVDAHDLERVLEILTDGFWCGSDSRRPPIVWMWERKFPTMNQKCRSVSGGLLFGRVESELELGYVLVPASVSFSYLLRDHSLYRPVGPFHRITLRGVGRRSAVNGAECLE